MRADGQCFAICYSARQQCVFIAFDLLYLNGKDLRTLPLIERKAVLKKLLRRKRSRILYLDHVESDGGLLFEQIVALDFEGIVCKRKDSPYKVTEKPSRNSRTSVNRILCLYTCFGHSPGD